MIRNSVAYCPSCMHILLFSVRGEYFWCDCDGWFFLPDSAKRKELAAAEKYDYRMLKIRARLAYEQQ